MDDPRENYPPESAAPVSFIECYSESLDADETQIPAASYFWLANLVSNLIHLSKTDEEKRNNRFPQTNIDLLLIHDHNNVSTSSVKK